AVPSARAPLQVEIVAQRLLVEARLHATRLIVLGGPEARAVGSQDFVDQRDAALTVASELELGIRNDDSAPRGDRTTTLVDQPAQALELARHVGTDDLGHARRRDVLVMTGLGFRRGAEQRGIESLALAKRRRHLLAGERSSLAV